MALTMVTGGARSGKSTFAENLVKEYVAMLGETEGSEVLYIATAIPYDDEMKDRIKRHQAQRPSHWRTVEAYQKLDQVVRSAEEKIILLDCITVMITNLLFAAGINEDHPDPRDVKEIERQIEVEIQNLLIALKERNDREVILVTNELGMGLVPAYPLGRIFRDIAGRANQRIAAQCDRVYLIVSGIPLPIKGDDVR